MSLVHPTRRKDAMRDQPRMTRPETSAGLNRYVRRGDCVVFDVGGTEIVVDVVQVGRRPKLRLCAPADVDIRHLPGAGTHRPSPGESAAGGLDPSVPACHN